MFVEAIDRVIRDNKDYIPPYGKQQTMYLRPNIFGHGAQIGLAPAPEYCFIVSVHPVGNYFKHGVRAAKVGTVSISIQSTNKQRFLFLVCFSFLFFFFR